MKPFVFRQDEIVNINTKKPLEFQLTDWRSFDFKPEFNPETDKGRYRKEFRVQIFGVTSRGRSVSAIIKGFKPFFYAEIPDEWNKSESKVEQLIKTVNKLVPDYEVKSLLSYKIIDQKKFRGFTNNTFYPFIKFEFQSISGFNKYKKALESPIVLGGVKIHLPLYESNLEPIMRLMHITDIEPSGWVLISKYKIPDEPFSKCQIDVETDYKYLKKLEKSDIAPIIIASYDIESDSSHGDFPQAIKKYNKLSTDIINHYQKTHSTISKLQKSNDNPTKLSSLVNSIQDKKQYFESLITAGFDNDIKNPLRGEDINYVYTKDEIKPSKDKIKEILPEVLKICDRQSISIRANREVKEAVQKVLRKWVYHPDLKSKFDKLKKNNKNGLDECLEKDIYELENIILKVSKTEEVDYNILYNKIFVKDVLITLLTNLFNKSFPAIEGDPVIQIATVVFKYGDPNVSYRHIVTLKSCDPIEDAEVISCEDEAEVLIEWAKFINKLDPDIMTGYNIFGFDYSFMYYRAKELGCLDEFCQISRLPNYEATLLEKTLCSAALGDNTMRFMDMIGRVQIDLLKVIQRDHNLGSYKLDSVAEHFISGKITNIDKTDPQWIEIKNSNEIEVGNYIIIRQAKDGDKFNKGEKIQVLDKELRDGKEWIKLDIPFDKKVLTKKPLWGLGKDDVNYKDIFQLQKTGGSSGRRIIGVYCIQDCILCIRIIRKLEIIANNIGMANVSIVPLSYIFLRGQGVKIFSLVSKECRNNNFLIPVLKVKDDDSKENQIKKLIKSLGVNPDGDDDNDDNDISGSSNNNINSNDDNLEVNNFRRGGDENYHIGGLESDNTGRDFVSNDDDGYEGAIVLDPKPGIYLNAPISVLDYGSLYPSSMISENLSHDSIILDPQFDNLEGFTYNDITYDVKKWIDPKKLSLGKHTVGQKTCRFVQFPDDENGKAVKGIIPMILQKLLAQRKACKKKKDNEPDPFKKNVWDALQLAYKVTANSLYGQIGARTSPIYLKDIAASTTATGRGLLTLARDFVIKNFEGAEVIYGDTDSIFIKFLLVDENGNKLTGVEALQKSIDEGIRADKLIQKYLKPPHVLEYEKTFDPFILFTKKRYVGNLYETDVNEYSQKSMGIVLKRRDNAPIVKYVYGGIIDCILNKKSLDLSIEFLKSSLMDLINDKFDLQMLVISKTLRSTYKDPESIAHKVLADRMGERDPGNKPQSNDRIPYIYIKLKTTNSKEKVLQGDKIEHINYVMENNLKPDYVTYLENQIMKPVSQIYELVIHKLDGFTKDEDYFERLEMRYNEKYADKSPDFIHDKIQKQKAQEVEKLLFQDALRKARNQKANLQEISGWLVIDEKSNFIDKEPEKVNKKSPKSDINIKKDAKKIDKDKPKKNHSIMDWLITS